METSEFRQCPHVHHVDLICYALVSSTNKVSFLLSSQLEGAGRMGTIVLLLVPLPPTPVLLGGVVRALVWSFPDL